MSSPQVLILQGSNSDNSIGEAAAEVLEGLNVPCSRRICSAHRTPHKLVQILEQAEQGGVQVVIAIAGLAAHLAGVVAAHSLLPVIGVPGSGGPLNGEDALLATVQMPKGVPVATVGIGNGANAGWLAARILALQNADLKERLVATRKTDEEKIAQQDAAIRKQS